MSQPPQEQAPPLATALSALAGRLLPGGVEAAHLTRLSGGASQEIWAFDVRHTAGHVVPFILRRASAAHSPRMSATVSLDTEATLLALAGATAVPVPAVRLRLQPEFGLGTGFIMDRVEGETLGRRIVHDERFATARPVLARQCGQALARIHALDVSTVAGLRTAAPGAELAQWRRMHREYAAARGLRRPVFELAFRWLEEHLPAAPERLALVHGDFRTGNLIVGPEGLRAVLDWELAHVGDPAEDLGWLCVNSWRFGASEYEVGGFGTLHDLLEGYVQGGGHADEPRIRYWQVFGTLRWGIICESMADAWLSGTERVAEKLAVGRRASEAEADLLELLAPVNPSTPSLPASAAAPASAASAASAAPAAPAAHGAPSRGGPEPDASPSAAQLLQAVSEHLRVHTMPALQGAAAFQARVAAGMVEMARREFEQGPAARERELFGLRRLAGPSGGTSHAGGTVAALRAWLCEAIAEGRCGLHTPGLREHLWSTTLDRLAIDQPDYSTFKRHRSG